MIKKNFVIIGAAGYIAQRHIKCIADLGHNLLAVSDPSDSIGIIDRYFDDTLYFRTIEDLHAYCHDNKDLIDYVVICSPNYMHYSHILNFMSFGDVICEKPLVIDYKLIDVLKDAEKQKKQKIYPILQARIHPTIQEIKTKIETGKRYKVNIKYMSKRSDWYLKSWKGDLNKSGGLLMNIGIHGFDVLEYLFGPHEGIFKIDGDCVRNKQTASGQTQYKYANVNWMVSTELKKIRKYTDKNVLREIEIDGIGSFEFSPGFCDLHIELYKKILNGEWNIDINDLKKTIEICRSDNYV
jgi:UDP-N-acetyl-2-amino-2-deoxyglucuronate dehydrogenase